MAGLATRVGQWLQKPFYQGFLLLLILITLFLSKPIFSGQPFLAADILFAVDPLWQPLAPAGFAGPANPILSDQVFEFYPWQKYIREELAQGRIPLWNPYVNSGHPLVANAQSALFAPFNVIALLWPLAQSFVVVAFLRLLCAGTFTLLLALELGLSRYAAFLAMIVFTFAAPQIVWLVYPKASVLVWLPAILFLSLYLIRTGRWRNVGWLGLAMAAQLVGGHPETSFYIVLTWLAFCGYWLWMRTKSGTYHLRRALVQLGMAGLLGLGAGAIQWLPTAEALWQSEILSERNQAALGWETFFFQWREWLAAATMLIPNFFGDPRHQDYWYPYSNFTEQTIFVGVLPLALAILVYLKGKRGEAAFFGILAIVTLGIALRLPGFTLLAELPGLSVTNSGRMRGIYILAIALLSGFGLDIARKNLASAEGNVQKLLTRILLMLGVAAFAVGASYLIGTFYQDQLVELGRTYTSAAQGNPFFFRPPEEYVALMTTRVQEMVASFHPANWTMYLPLILAWALIVLVALITRAFYKAEQRAHAISLVIIALVLGELWFVGLDFNSTIAPELLYPTPQLVDTLIQERVLAETKPWRVVGRGLALVPNVNMVFGLEDIRGYDPISPGRYMDVVGHLPGAVRVGHHLLFNELSASLLDFLNVGYAFAPDTAEAAAALDERWRPVQEGEGVALYANSEAMPRAYMVYASRRASTPEESLAMTLAPDFDFRNQVVLEGVGEALVQLPPGLSARVEMTNMIPGEMTIHVETAMPGYLVMSDPYTSGWVAEVDGKAAQLLIANHAFRSVAVPEGNHSVTLRYQPFSFVIGAWISAISLALLLLLLIFGGGNPMEALLNDAAQRAQRYLDDLDERSVAPLSEDVSRLVELGGALPDDPGDPAATLALLDDIGSPATVASAGSRYFGFVVGGSLPVALAANWLVGAWDQVAGLTIMSPVAAAVEQITLPWLLDILGLPSTSGGAFVTGATMANFSGLLAARHAVLAKVGWDVEAQGLFGAPPVNVVVGNEVHVSLLKALGLAGFGRQRVMRVAADGQGRMRADELAALLPQLSGPTILCIQAGNVNTGAFDPARELCALAREAGAWVHVDGAFGLWAAAAPTRAHLTEGFGEADSWAVDAHKWLNVPYDSALAFVRDRQALQASMTITAAYLMQGENREPYHYTPEMSRRARGVEIWAALRTLGRSGLAAMIERNCQFATRFAQGFAEAGYQVLNDVVLNQVLVSFGDAATTQQVIAAIQADGTCWCGSSVWQGHSAIRVSVSSWATTEEDVERSLAAMLQVAKKITRTRLNIEKRRPNSPCSPVST